MTIDRILQLQSSCCADLCCDAADLHGLRQTDTDGFSGIQCASNIVDGVFALRSNHFNFIDAFHRTDHSRICLREYCIHEQVFDLGDRVTQERLDTFFTNFNDIHLCSIGFQAFDLISLRFIQLDLCLRDVGQAVIDDAVLCGDECIHASATTSYAFRCIVISSSKFALLMLRSKATSSFIWVKSALSTSAASLMPMLFFRAVWKLVISSTK